MGGWGVKVRAKVRVDAQVMVGGRGRVMSWAALIRTSRAVVSTAMVRRAHRELDHARVVSVLLVGLHAVPHLVPLHALLHDRAVLLAQPLRSHLALANVQGRCECVRAWSGQQRGGRRGGVWARRAPTSPRGRQSASCPWRRSKTRASTSAARPLRSDTRAATPSDSLPDRRAAGSCSSCRRPPPSP